MSFEPYIVLNNVRIAYGDETVFDDWGRVRSDVAAQRTLPLHARADLRVVRDIKEAATLTASLATEYAEAVSSLAIGALDTSCLKALQFAFHRRALSAHRSAC